MCHVRVSTDLVTGPLCFDAGIHTRTHARTHTHTHTHTRTYIHTYIHVCVCVCVCVCVLGWGPNGTASTDFHVVEDVLSWSRGP
jgi:hypothetical protein